MLRGELFRVPHRVAGAMECADADEMGPDVVGMAIPAELVVRGHDVRADPADEPDESADRLIDVGLPERPRVAVAGVVHHPGVAVAEIVPLGHAELAHRGLELAGADLAEAAMVVGRVHVGDDDLAELAAGAGHEDDAMAVRDGLGHHPAGPDGLVVWVGMDGHEGQGAGLGHGRILARHVTEQRNPVRSGSPGALRG